MLALTIIATIMLGLFVIIMFYGLIDYSVDRGGKIVFIIAIAILAYLISVIWILYKR